MKKYVMLISIMAVMTGCATTSDVETVQANIDSLSMQSRDTANAARSAKQEADAALVQAVRAEKAAVLAEKYIKDVNDKLDRVFAKSQYK